MARQAQRMASDGPLRTSARDEVVAAPGPGATPSPTPPLVPAPSTAANGSAPEAPAAPPEPARRRTYWPELDGLRALAVLAVMAYHLNIHRVQGGWVGVDVFFLLSGFLITSILLGEIDKRSNVRFGRFYARRAYRLAPALVAVLVVAVVASLLLPHEQWSHPTIAGLPYVIFYAGNWALVFGVTNSLGLLSHTWSLAVEEQFYLIWPAIMAVVLSRFKRREMVAYVLVGLVVVEGIYRFLLLSHGIDGGNIWRIGSSLDTRSDGLLLGCALAFYLSARRTEPIEPRTSRQRVSTALAVGALAVLALVMTQVSELKSGLSSLELSAVVVATGIILWHVVTCRTSLLHRVLAHPAMVWTGRRSYGLYLWHTLIIAIVAATSLAHLKHRSLFEFVLMFVVAALSYRFIEQPFLRRKDRLA